MSNAGLPLPLLISLLFMIMGPVSLLPMFASITKDLPLSARARIAGVACAIALFALALAILAGGGAMAKVGASPPALIIGGGLILTFQSLRTVLGYPAPSSGGMTGHSKLGMALSPVAIPGIVSPLAVAILIIFASYFPAGKDLMMILLAVTTVIAIDFAFLIAAPGIIHLIGMPPLIVLGAVFGVLQVALGVEMIIDGVGASTLFASPARSS